MDSFWLWWQHLPSHMNPVIVKLGSFQLKWYGMMYLINFVLAYFLAVYRTKQEKRFSIYTGDTLQNFLMYQVFGVMIGGRLGYVLFYNLPYYLANPMEAFLPFGFGPEGGLVFKGFAGMSYHGGLMGVIIASILFVRIHKVNFWNMADLWAPIVPLGYTFGRLGNFINGELWGRATDLPVGMHFPEAPGDFLRHPSQLYEGFTEGILLFTVLWTIRRWRIPRGAMLGLYVVGYSIARFMVEFVREPDDQLGFVFLQYSMGQVLSTAMFLMGIAAVVYAYNTQPMVEKADTEPPVLSEVPGGNSPELTGESSSDAKKKDKNSKDKKEKKNKKEKKDKKKKH